MVYHIYFYITIYIILYIHPSDDTQIPNRTGSLFWSGSRPSLSLGLGADGSTELSGTAWNSVAGGAMWSYTWNWLMITPCSWDVFGYIMIYYIYFICMVTPPWSTWKHFRWELSCVDSIEPPGRGHCWEYCIPVEFLQFGACFSPLCQITYGPFGSYKML